MTDNLFAQAIKAGEVGQFFRGEGAYFSRNREDGSHAFLSHMSGWVVSFVESSPGNARQFDEAFILYLGALVVNVDEFHGFQMNIIAYFRLKARGMLNGSHLFEGVVSRECVLMGEYLSAVDSSSVVDESIINAKNYWLRSGDKVMIELFSRVG